MKHIWLLAKITYKEGLRNRILLGILFFGVVLCALNLIFTNMFTHDLGKVAVDVGLSVVSVAGLVIIFFMGINLLTRDLDKRTVYMVLSRPIARWQYIIGKFCGLGLMALTSVVILGLFALVFINVAMHNAPDYIPPNFSWTTLYLALLFIWMSLLMITALAILFTSITSSSFMAMMLTACGYFIGQNVEIVRKMYAGADSGVTDKALKQIIEWVSWIFPNLSAFDLKTPAAYGLTLDGLELAWSGIYGISYIGVVLIIAIVIFQRRELT